MCAHVWLSPFVSLSFVWTRQVAAATAQSSMHLPQILQLLDSCRINF
jgi:hypothetical protein